eukprot:6200647-Pleurochrysis_carterae.AAC.2
MGGAGDHILADISSRIVCIRANSRWHAPASTEPTQALHELALARAFFTRQRAHASAFFFRRRCRF